MGACNMGSYKPFFPNDPTFLQQHDRGMIIITLALMMGIGAEIMTILLLIDLENRCRYADVLDNVIDSFYSVWIIIFIVIIILINSGWGGWRGQHFRTMQ